MDHCTFVKYSMVLNNKNKSNVELDLVGCKNIAEYFLYKKSEE